MTTSASRPLLIIVSVVVLGALGFAGYRWYTTETSLQERQAELSKATENIATLEGTLATKESENRQLAEALYTEQQRNEAFAEQINEISGTVGKLDKLSKTDPELLQKYSKVYFLNENYTPDSLKKIPESLTFNKQEEYLQVNVLSVLQKMIHDAEEDDASMSVLSGYRSFSTQAILKENYRVTYGSGANAFSADQGYSEHQLGTTVDLTVTGSLQGFDTTEAFSWLTKNAYKYGFVLSYPNNNSFYQYEPWHWRFVGKDLARDLHNDGKYFYDLDQRDIDAYLVEIFD